MDFETDDIMFKVEGNLLFHRSCSHCILERRIPETVCHCLGCSVAHERLVSLRRIQTVSYLYCRCFASKLIFQLRNPFRCNSGATAGGQSRGPAALKTLLLAPLARCFSTFPRHVPTRLVTKNTSTQISVQTNLSKKKYHGSHISPTKPHLHLISSSLLSEWQRQTTR